MKSLILVHILMHEGNGEAIYDYVSSMPSVLDLSKFRDRNDVFGPEQSKNIKMYANYLRDKSYAFKTVNIDFVLQKRNKSSQIYSKTISNPKTLLSELTTVQKQLHSLLKCQFEPETLNNECTFSMFRYCLRDMLKLFQTMNEGAIKTLSIFFDLPEVDMSRALDLYKRFVKLIERTNDYLDKSRRFEPLLGFTIPELLHAPITLASTLEDHLKLGEKDKLQAAKDIKDYKRQTINPLTIYAKTSISDTYKPNLQNKPSTLNVNSTTTDIAKKPPLASNNTQQKPTVVTKKPSNDNLIDFFSNIDESINQSSPTTNNQAFFANNNTYLNNPDQMNHTVNLLQNRNSKFFPPDNVQDPNFINQHGSNNNLYNTSNLINSQFSGTVNSNNPYSNSLNFNNTQQPNQNLFATQNQNLFLNQQPQQQVLQNTQNTYQTQLFNTNPLNNTPSSNSNNNNNNNLFLGSTNVNFDPLQNNILANSSALGLSNPVVNNPFMQQQQQQQQIQQNNINSPFHQQGNTALNSQTSSVFSPATNNNLSQQSSQMQLLDLGNALNSMQISNNNNISSIASNPFSNVNSASNSNINGNLFSANSQTPFFNSAQTNNVSVPSSNPFSSNLSNTSSSNQLSGMNYASNSMFNSQTSNSPAMTFSQHNTPSNVVDNNNLSLTQNMNNLNLNNNPTFNSNNNNNAGVGTAAGANANFANFQLFF
ncbi:ENTH domain-containing protein [Smittium culicis]|uniref:ENTH domain-containing protein n=1 Tax=Smittium culicis TaxID=133412 RepID=A0A1R1XNA5_9FUNG|nr:ENTH domain-containing protein [Smittium culicis]